MDIDMASSSWTAACDTDQAAEAVLRHASSVSDVAVDNNYFNTTQQLGLDDPIFDDLFNSIVPESETQEPSLGWPSNTEPQHQSPLLAQSVETAMNGISPASSSSNSSTMQQQHNLDSGLSTYGAMATMRGGLPPTAFQRHNPVQQPSPITPMNYYNQPYSNNQLYHPPAPPAPPPMAIPNGYYVDPAQYNTYHSSPYYTPSRQGTEDLLDDDNIIHEEGEDGGVEASDPCYAQLLFKCLRDAPNHTLSLKSLYDWVQQNSQKARDSTSKGWQNSVRHNLSMNAAFERVTSTNATASTASKKGSLWRVTQTALRDGVISTTRYRKDPKKKPERRSSPALKRQISGAKGGKATRDASAHRKAVLARANNHASNSGYSVLNSLERQRQQARFPPTSMPTPASASASPGLFPHHMSSVGPTSGPPSPYFPIQHAENEPWTHMQPLTYSNPNTPMEIQVGAFGDPAKAVLGNFELAAYPSYAYANGSGLESPVTPGMESFYSDDNSVGMGVERATSEGVYT